MTRLEAAELRVERRTGQRHVADHVEQLVPNEFVRVAQAFFVHDRLAVEHDRVRKRPAKRKPVLLQVFDLMAEAERPCPRDFRLERRRIEVERIELPVDNAAVFERDLKVGRKADARPQLGILVAVFHAHRFAHADRAHRFALRHDARAFDQEHERRRAAVHDRHFRAVDFDDEVGNAEADDSGHQVLNRVNLHAIDVADRRTQARVGDAIKARRHDARDSRMICAAENDARAFRRRQQGNGGQNPSVYANALADHLVLNRLLQRHYPSHELLVMPSASRSPNWAKRTQNREHTAEAHLGRPSPTACRQHRPPQTGTTP